MQTISMTELRFKPKELLQTLHQGNSVDLIHRSVPVATINPKHTQKQKKFNLREFNNIVAKLNFKPLTINQIDKLYYKAMIQKHGKYIL